MEIADCPSPNFGERKGGQMVELIVLHYLLHSGRKFAQKLCIISQKFFAFSTNVNKNRTPVRFGIYSFNQFLSFQTVDDIGQIAQFYLNTLTNVFHLLIPFCVQ